jgi:hypothetical protein
MQGGDETGPHENDLPLPEVPTTAKTMEAQALEELDGLLFLPKNTGRSAVSKRRKPGKGSMERPVQAWRARISS